MHSHECPLCRKEKPNAGFSLLSISRKDHEHMVGVCAECADALEYALAAPLRDGPVIMLDWMPKEVDK